MNAKGQAMANEKANAEREAMLRAMRERAAKARAAMVRPMTLADARSYAPASDRRAK
jgi:hypothetical protein